MRAPPEDKDQRVPFPDVEGPPLDMACLRLWVMALGVMAGMGCGRRGEVES